MYVKQLELTNFKSFGGTTAVPTLKGFTVISGPNGSGKSNLLDAMLFALGLSSSKGMRAERLPDLVNHAQIKRGHSVIETRVTVSFALEQRDLDDLGEDAHKYIAPPIESTTPDGDDAAKNSGPDAAPQVRLTTHQHEDGPEWRVTRRLRVTKQGTYTSAYAMNEQPCTLTELHQNLSRLRIYPEGYNVVLQGDVTGIITMNPRQRREIIDELAGVATFDRQINQAKEKLESVKDQEERSRIVELELVEQRDRLARDRLKAEKYKKLRTELHEKQTWEGVLAYRRLVAQIQSLSQAMTRETAAQATLKTQIADAGKEITVLANELSELNQKVKALGEEEQLKLQAQIASGEAEVRQLEKQHGSLDDAIAEHRQRIQALEQQIQAHQTQTESLKQQQITAETEDVQTLTQAKEEAEAALTRIRSESQDLASSADAWMQQQSELRQRLESIRSTLEPHRAEQVQLQERCEQLKRSQQAQAQERSELESQIQRQQLQLTELQADAQDSLAKVQALAEGVGELDQAVTTSQKTLERLSQEQRDKQRQLDKLEAQDQAQQEAQGTYASKVILNSGIRGVCGLVANLGRVEPQYQTALEIAAGNRIGNLVVDDDRVAAEGIELLKQQRAGRATFLPLNKLRNPKSLQDLGFLDGAVGYAMDLIDFDPKYEAVFANVFGGTVVFESLSSARRYIGRYRMVTLDGELLEPSGAMTGGSRSKRSTLKFGTAEAGESQEVQAMRDRLEEIMRLLHPLERQLAKSQAQLRERTQQLGTERQRHREAQFKSEQLEAQLKGLFERRDLLQQQADGHQGEITAATSKLADLEDALPNQEKEFAQVQTQLAELEQSQTHGEWQTLQTRLSTQEQVVSEREAALREAQQKILALGNERDRLAERITLSTQEIENAGGQIDKAQAEQVSNLVQQQEIEQSMLQLRLDMEALEDKIGAQKQARDQAEAQVRAKTEAKQKLMWELEKLEASHQEHQAALEQQEAQRRQQEAELPNPLPEIPEALDLEELLKTLKSLRRRLEAMEPVNMLAIEEYDRTQARLEELTQKLQTLEEERTELLLRVEKFTTLRLQSFKDAFDVVNENFQQIFGGLSDGDGFLQLEHPEDPFQGGLNLVAHPKGKAVQRLASMSGGEKSLTALSFIFALQKYRPSPFYALDEVDSFLDGVNVEKLSRTIQSQASETQFLVVSHRRPMIEAADRTIGVTQAKGTHTQVIGMQLRSQGTQPKTEPKAAPKTEAIA
ncbi:MAG: chromosome segregation protein SMC [Cyanobacteria bacterium P01_F01_bin.42]